MGIDFTFGYFTAVETLAGEIRNLLDDAEASRAYFLTETMGRSAGWLAYGAAIAGEASLVISVEDIIGNYRDRRRRTSIRRRAKRETRDVMDVDDVVNRIVKTMRPATQEGQAVRRDRDGRRAGRVLPMKYLEGIPRDEHGHISISHVNLGRMFAKLVTDEYKRQTGQEAQGDRPATRLRSPLCPAARVRRDARQPTRRRRLSRAGRRRARTA